MTAAHEWAAKQIICAAFDTALDVQCTHDKWCEVPGLNVAFHLGFSARKIPNATEGDLLNASLMVADCKNGKITLDTTRFYRAFMLVMANGNNPAEYIIEQSRLISFQFLSMFFDSLLPEERRYYKVPPETLENFSDQSETVETCE